MRGEIFCDRLGAGTEILLAGAGLGITAFRKTFGMPDAISCGLFAMEIVGALLIARSRFGPMRLAMWLFVFRVVAGLAYVSVMHQDKLARSTLGFPVVVLAYCIMRTRAMKRELELL